MGASPSMWRKLLVDLNIDVLLNPFIPHNHFNLLPDHISHWFGHRSHETKDPPAIVRFPFIFLATVAGLCLVGGIYSNVPGIKEWHPPLLIASLGATAVLNYNTIQSPLSQPRNVIMGHTLAAIIGVGISKLFQLNPDFDNIQWVSASVACACSSLAMSLVNCLHPPGGATAVLASADTQVLALGWHFVPLVLLASSLMTVVACIFNNIARRYPLFWWTPEETGQLLPYPSSRRKRRDESDHEATDVETDVEAGKLSLSEHGPESGASTLDGAQPGRQGLRASSLRAQLPVGMELSAEEIVVLDRLDDRLQSWTAARA